MKKSKKNIILLKVINIIILIAILFIGELLGKDNKIYTKFPKDFLGIDGNNMTKDKLILIFKKKNVKYKILVDEPTDLWIGSEYFIGRGLEEFTIRYVVYSFPSIGGTNLEIEIELEKSQFKKLLNKLKKSLGNCNIGYESYGERKYRYYHWISDNKIYEGIEEIFLSFQGLFIEPRSKQDSMFLLIRWYSNENKDIYAPIHE